MSTTSRTGDDATPPHVVLPSLLLGGHVVEQVWLVRGGQLEQRRWEGGGDCDVDNVQDVRPAWSEHHGTSQQRTEGRTMVNLF